MLIRRFLGIVFCVILSGVAGPSLAQNAEDQWRCSQLNGINCPDSLWDVSWAAVTARMVTHAQSVASHCGTITLAGDPNQSYGNISSTGCGNWGYALGYRTNTCVAPQVWDYATQACANGSSSPDLEAVKAAAFAAAKAAGLDDTAATYAADQAGTSFTAWLTAGKSVDESKKAAALRGLAAGQENVYNRFSSQKTAMKTACSENASSAACTQAQNTYYTSMSTAGVDATTPYRLETTNADGSLIQYSLNGNGNWDVYKYNASGKLDSFMGTLTTLEPLPTKTTPVTYNSPLPPITTVNDGKPVPNVNGPITHTVEADSSGKPVTVLELENQRLVYLNSTDGTTAATVTKNPNGSYTTTGTLPAGTTGEEAINQHTAAMGQFSGTGTGSVSTGVGALCGAPGQQPCATKSSGATTEEKDQLAVDNNGVLEAAKGTPEHGWTFNPFTTLPNATCSPWVMTFGSRSVTIDPCPTLDKLRELLSYAFYILTMMAMFQILFRQEH